MRCCIQLLFIYYVFGSIYCNNDFVFNKEIKPITLIYPNNEHNKLIFNESACKLLSSDIDWKIVSVIGPYHSGKSFLLNALTNITDIFPVVNSNKPTTQGIQMFISQNEKIIYLDTEGLSSGLSNSTEEYDAMIFSIASLASNLMIYNTIRTIDQQQLDYLELLSRRAQLFALKSELQNSGELTKSFISFPPLFWVVRDYALDEKTEQWFSLLLEANQRKAFEKASLILNKEKEPIRLQKLFETMKAFTLFLPHSNKNDLKELKIKCLNEEFLKELQLLRNSIKNTLNDYSTSTRQFCSTIKFYVHAANNNLFPMIPTVWDGYIIALKKSVKESILNFATNSTNKIINSEDIFTNEEIIQKEINIKNDCNKIAKKMLFGIKDLTQNVMDDIEIDISNPLSIMKQINNDKIINFISQKAFDTRLYLLNSINQKNYPLSKKDLSHQIKNLQKKYEEIMFDIFLKYHSTQIPKNLKTSSFDEIENKNKLELINIIKVLTQQTLDLFSTKTILLSNDQIEIELMKRLNDCKKYFIDKIQYFNDWDEITVALKDIDNQLTIKKNKAVLKNREMLLKYLENEKNLRFDEFEKIVSEIKLPMIVNELSELLNKIENTIITKFKSNCVNFLNDATFSFIMNDLKNLLALKKDVIDKKNAEKFIQITLYDFDRIRRQIKIKNYSFYTPWSLKSTYKFLYSEAIKNSIPDEKTRNKIVDSFILEEYNDEINFVSLKFFSIVIIILSLIFTIIYKIYFTR